MSFPGPRNGLHRSRAVTRDDVARRAGVSPAVVSYVINAGPRPVAQATRLRVQQAIDELKYRPNATARALKLNRTRTLGLIVRDNANPFFAEFAREVEDCAFARDHAVLLGNSSGNPERETAYIDNFLDRSVDGIMIIGLSHLPALQNVLDRGTRLVILDKTPIRPGIATVLVDNIGGAYAGTRHLIEQGHINIGCVAGPAGIAASDERVLGWRNAMSSASLQPPPAVVVRNEFSSRGGFEATMKLLSLHPQPSAIFVSSDIQAAGALAAIHAANLRVPDDISVVSFDGTVGSAFANPPLTVVRQPFAEMARLSVSILLDGPNETEHTLATELVLRSSSRRWTT